MRAERSRGSRIRSQSSRNELIEKIPVKRPGIAGLFLFLLLLFFVIVLLCKISAHEFLRARVFTVQFCRKQEDGLMMAMTRLTSVINRAGF
jgi:hypothetical protein